MGSRNHTRGELSDSWGWNSARRSLGIGLAVLLCSQHAHGFTFFPPRDLAELGRASEAVVLAVAREGTLDGVGPWLATRTKFSVVDVVHGGLKHGSEFDVEVPGGLRPDGSGVVVSGMPQFAAGKTYLLFLNRTASGAWCPRVCAYGVFEEQKAFDGKTSLLVPVAEARRGHPLPRLDGVAVEALTTCRTLDLLEHLRSVLGNKEEWNIAEVAEVVGDGVAAAAPTECVPLGEPSRWRTFDSGGSISIVADADGDPSLPTPGNQPDVQGAVDVWNDISGTSVDLRFGGTATLNPNCARFEGKVENAILFDDPCGIVPDLEDCIGTAALGGYFINGDTHSFDGSSWRDIAAWFVVVNNGVGDCIPNSIYTLMLAHELGHGLGFGHYDDPNALMSASCCTPPAEVDRLCVRYTYPGPAAIEVTPAVQNFGSVFIGSTTAPAEVTMRNTGVTDLHVSEIAFSAPCEEYTITGSTSPTIPPAGTATVSVTYSPTDANTDNCILEIHSDAANTPRATVLFSGVGVPEPAPEIHPEPAIVAFGNVQVGALSGEQTVTIRNVGTATLEVSSISLSGQDCEQFQLSGPSSTSVPPGGRIPLGVVFSPSSTGTASCALLIESNDADEPSVSVPLSGTGTPEPTPEIQVTPSLHDFGEVGDTPGASVDITIENVGTADLAVDSIGFGAGSCDEFAYEGVDAVAIAPGGRVTGVIRYQPIDAGADMCNLEISSNDADEPLVILSLSAVGRIDPKPELELSGDVADGSVEFGEVFVGSVSAVRSVVVSNQGDANLEVNVSLGDGSCAEYSIEGLGIVTLEAGESISVDVTYSPVDLTHDCCVLVIASNDADESLIEVSLNGTGVPAPQPELDVSPNSTLEFPPLQVGESLRRAINVRNIGSAPLEISSIATGAGDCDEFAVTEFSVVLDPGQEATVEVDYTPVDAGADQCNLVFLSNDPDSPSRLLSLVGSGEEPPGAAIQFSTGIVVFSGDRYRVER